MDIWYGLAEVGFVQFADVAHWDAGKQEETIYTRDKV